MKSLKAGAILLPILATAFLLGCAGTGKNSNTQAGTLPANKVVENSNSPRTNVEDLGLLVNIPFETEDVVWKDYATQKRIVAVVRFSSADAAKVVAEAEKLRPSENASVATETWFPAELIAQAEMHGGDSLPGRAYAANQFFQEPYMDGSVTRIENTDYFVLDLRAK